MDDLKKQKIWVCWKGEIQEGRPSKILYSYKGFKQAQVKSMQTIGVIMKMRFSKVENDFDGVGLVLPPGIGGIDLDDIEADNALLMKLEKL